MGYPASRLPDKSPRKTCESPIAPKRETFWPWTLCSGCTYLAHRLRHWRGTTVAQTSTSSQRILMDMAGIEDVSIVIADHTISGTLSLSFHTPCDGLAYTQHSTVASAPASRTLKAMCLSTAHFPHRQCPKCAVFVIKVSVTRSCRTTVGSPRQ